VNIFIKHLIRAWFLALAVTTSAQAQTAQGHIKTANGQILAAITNSPLEKDPRVQANGKIWRLERADITDASLPRVLLVGDSILNGYLNRVAKSLQGKANVDAWVNPYYHSQMFNNRLAEVLTNGSYAIVHINAGLHGWQPGRIPPGQYEPLSRALIDVIRQQCPKAKIIWANTTPIMLKGQPSRLDPELNPIIVEQNQTAAKVMAEMQVPVNDFYAVATNHLALAKGDGFHWNAPAYELYAIITTDSILRELNLRAPLQHE